MPDDLNVRRVSLQERTLPMGNVVGINAYKVNRVALRTQIEEEGYDVHETQHFFVVMRPVFPSVIVIHWFAPHELDASIGDFLLHELKQVGILHDTQDYNDAFGAIVGSLSPHDTQQAWYRYTVNTLQCFRHLLDNRANLPLQSTLGTFATLYRRVDDLLIGETLLDAGCSTGYLPLLVAARYPAMTKVVGVDIRSEPFAIAQVLAEEQRLRNIQFIQASLVHDDLNQLGLFDTVTLLHVLEHFTEQDMYPVLANLLAITNRRLIIAVPYENTPELVYGHQQLFTREKLAAVGQWCIQQRAAETWYEECADGLLVVENKLG